MLRRDNQIHLSHLPDQISHCWTKTRELVSFHRLWAVNKEQEIQWLPRLRLDVPSHCLCLAVQLLDMVDEVPFEIWRLVAKCGLVTWKQKQKNSGLQVGDPCKLRTMRSHCVIQEPNDWNKPLNTVTVQGYSAHLMLTCKRKKPHIQSRIRRTKPQGRSHALRGVSWEYLIATFFNNTNKIDGYE